MTFKVLEMEFDDTSAVLHSYKSCVTCWRLHIMVMTMTLMIMMRILSSRFHRWWQWMWIMKGVHWNAATVQVVQVVTHRHFLEVLEAKQGGKHPSRSALGPFQPKILRRDWPSPITVANAGLLLVEAGSLGMRPVWDTGSGNIPQLTRIPGGRQSLENVFDASTRNTQKHSCNGNAVELCNSE